MEKGINRFNLRVYLLILHEGRLLLADEIIRGMKVTKFPGGGLELGESIEECARREASEELGAQITGLQHFYTTDFFIRSLFNPADQIISVYYSARLVHAPAFSVQEQKFNFRQQVSDEEVFRWIKPEALNPEEFALPADRRVAELVKQRGF